jgi:hypothetical protein
MKTSKKNDTEVDVARKRWPEGSPQKYDSDALGRFVRNARAFIVGNRSPKEWTEAQHLGHQLLMLLGQTFASGPPSEGAVPKLRAAVAAFQTGHVAARYYAARAIADAGAAWPMTAERDRPRLLEETARRLGFLDTALFCLGDGEVLRSKLEQFAAEPRGKRGKKGAEKILAEVIVELCPDGALGIKPRRAKSAEDGVDDVERIRKELARDVDDFLSSMNPASE